MDVEPRQHRDKDQDAADSVPYSDELLVDMVRARENLFDKGRVDYKDEQAKAQAWDGIAVAFGMRVEECQTRWVRLRERFGRELRLHKRGVPPGKEWPLFSRMRWLERFIQPRNRVGGAKAHVAALHAAMARERHGLGHGLGLGLAALGVAPAPAPGPGTAAAAPASSTASDSGDGMVAAGEEAAPGPGATSGPLWPHTYKLWATAAGDHLQHHSAHHAMEDEDSQQDMAVDLATHASHSSTTPSDDFHHGPADGALRVPLGGLIPAGPLSSPNAHDPQDFQDAVRQSLAAVAASLESMERHLSQGGGGRPAHPEDQDPDELFARSLAATLRHLPKPRRSQAKMRLIAVLAEFEDES
ncbi:Transcription factor Adf-1 [Frankliniella fusca]|uniref:Transcription factor Adf-1 n=1 Tax=Frankliniella fusca TaxID=407009 RepID=A0AAE1HRP3_9NEOP|nr:Transcription factor Adf-1 [Frankliniella fusca]